MKMKMTKRKLAGFRYNIYKNIKYKDGIFSMTERATGKRINIIATDLEYDLFQNGWWDYSELEIYGYTLIV